jgi:arylsulfatase A-like enzyme
MCDEFRADALGFQGNPVVKTPNLDAFALDCAVFTNAYTTCPMCAPARASLATGRYPLSHGVLDNQFAPVEDEVMLYSTLRDHGFRTTLHGKLHTNRAEELCGFEASSHGRTAPGAARGGRAGAGAMAQTPPDYFKKNEGDISLFIYGDSPLPAERTGDSRLADSYIELLDGVQGQSSPVFMKLSMNDPHTPYLAATPYNRMYDYRDVDMPPNVCHSLEGKPVTHRYFHKVRGFDRLTEEDFRRSKASYYGLVTHADERIGRVIHRLKELDLYDDSIVIFLSDHGSMMGEHGFVEKWGHMYEPVVRIPFMIKFPRSQYRGTYESFMEIIDVMPTILDAVNVPIPASVQGKSLLPMLVGGGQHKSEVYSEYFCGSVHVEPALMIRDRKWKFALYPMQQSIHDNLFQDHYLKHTRFFDSLVEGELYDMENDPYEMNNLYDRPEYKEVCNEYRGKLEAWKTSLGRLADYSSLFAPVERKVPQFQLLQADNRLKIHRHFTQTGTIAQCVRQKETSGS